MADLSEDQRRYLYSTLLESLAQQLQDRLCAEDRNHVWGPWVATMLNHDRPLRYDAREANEAFNEVYHLRHDRKCLNCGKEQFNG